MSAQVLPEAVEPVPDAGTTALSAAAGVADTQDSVMGEMAAELTAPVGAVGDSVTVAVWTVVSRVSGFLRVAAVAAVLGATFFGNSYQFTNTLPSLIYYGFLAGSLFSSLLVPALVKHIDRGEVRSAERVARGLFGVVTVCMLVAFPLAVLVAPELLHVAATGTKAAGSSDVGQARLLVAMVMPQIFLYGVIGTATAVQNAHRRFALAAAAPTIQNVGTIVVLFVVWALFPAASTVNGVPLAELLILGLGSTGAVALQAAAQWVGARRCGISLAPRAGWRDEEVRVVIRRAVPSLVQAGAAASELIFLLVLADRVAGGVVAFQIALNFYFLPVAIAATPVALSLIPRLSRIEGHSSDFHDTLIRGLAFAAFLVLPSATGYAVLGGVLGKAIALGRMSSPFAVGLVSASLRTLAPGLIGESAFLILTYSAYARRDTRTPLRAMCVQAAVCVSVACTSLAVHGTASLAVLGAALSAGTLTSTVVLFVLLTRHQTGQERLGQPLRRIALGAALMAIPAWATGLAMSHWLGGRTGVEVAALVAVLVGAAVFLGWQALCKARELHWVTASFGLRGAGFE